MTAYSAAKEGLHVVLLEPGEHLAGMVTGGLSATDIGHPSVIGGYARDFYWKAAVHYDPTNFARPEDWRSEPHVGETIFRTMLKRAGVAVHFHERLRESNGVHSAGKSIRDLETTDGRRWPAHIFQTAPMKAM
jgi:glycine/D-amino acid oxidase-like deaminating enzyme